MSAAEFWLISIYGCEDGACKSFTSGINVNLTSAIANVTSVGEVVTAIGTFKFTIQPFGGTLKEIQNVSASIVSGVPTVVINAYDANDKVINVISQRNITQVPNGNIPDGRKAEVIVSQIINNQNYKGKEIKFKLDKIYWQMTDGTERVYLTNNWFTNFVNLGGCVDSDGGKNPKTKGTVSMLLDTIYRYTDFCINDGSLKEFYCGSNGYRAEEIYTCLCKDGACQISCTDECGPNGKTECIDIQKMITCGNYDEDFCLEWSAPQTCPAGGICKDGSCPTVTCTDSDQKNDFYCIKGTVEIVLRDEAGSPILTFRHPDYCKDQNVLVEGFCEGIDLKREEYICPNSCLNGACLPASPSVKNIFYIENILAALSNVISELTKKVKELFGR